MVSQYRKDWMPPQDEVQAAVNRRLKNDNYRLQAHVDLLRNEVWYLRKRHRNRDLFFFGAGVATLWFVLQVYEGYKKGNYDVEPNYNVSARSLSHDKDR